MVDRCTYVPLAHRKSDRLAINVRHTKGEWGIGVQNTPANPRVEPRSAKHGIEALLERRVLTQVLRPRWHFLERVAHCSGDRTRVRWHESVVLRGISA